MAFVVWERTHLIELIERRCKLEVGVFGTRWPVPVVGSWIADLLQLLSGLRDLMNVRLLILARHLVMQTEQLLTKALSGLVATVYFLVDQFLRWVGQALLIRSQESYPAECLRVSELLLGISMFVD